jgi:hypothetical protein
MGFSMKIKIVLALALSALTAGAAVRSVSVNENGVLLAPTGLFTVNSNALDAAISRDSLSNVTTAAFRMVSPTITNQFITTESSIGGGAWPGLAFNDPSRHLFTFRDDVGARAIYIGVIDTDIHVGDRIAYGVKSVSVGGDSPGHIWAFMEGVNQIAGLRLDQGASNTVWNLTAFDDGSYITGDAHVIGMSNGVFRLGNRLYPVEVLGNPLTLGGPMAIPPVTNSNPWTVSVGINSFQRNVTATNGTVTFSGTPVDGAIVYYELKNASVTNFDITIPSSLALQNTGNGAITSVTCVSNSVTTLRWERVSGAWQVSVYSPDPFSYSFGANAAAGQALTIHSLTGGPGGGLLITNAAAAGGATAFNDIGDATGNGTIQLGTGEQIITTGVDGDIALTIYSTNATLSAETSLMSLDIQSNPGANGVYLKMQSDIGGGAVENYKFTTAGLTLGGVSITYSDNIKQTFNPGATTAGFNFGAHTADPSSLANGDAWYNSTGNQLKARINGATVVLGASTSSGTTTNYYIAADQGTTSGTAVNVTDAVFAIGANEIWSVEFHLGLTLAGAGADPKFAVDVPTGATVGGNVHAISGGGAIFREITADATLTSGTINNTPGMATISVLIQNGANAGNVQLQFASGDGATSTSIRGDMSYWVARKIN